MANASTEPLDESWMEDVDAASASEGDRWSDNFIKLMTKSQLDVKVLEVGDCPRVMMNLSDREGNRLVNKYDPLNKQIWQRLRSRTDAPEVYPVCEKALRVVEGYNLEFFNYEDYQYLGAYLADKGKHKSAGWLFTEALKSETADAYINKGVFHFRSGGTGVFDNYRLAQKQFEKGLGLIFRMRLDAAEERHRRNVCQDAMDEIDYRTSRGFAKLIKTILRLLRFHLKQDIFYVGVADPKQLKNTSILRLMTDTIAKYELQMFKESIDNFIYTVKIEVPSNSEDMGLTLDGLSNQVRAASTESEVVRHILTLGEIYGRVSDATLRRNKAVEEAKREAGISILDRLTADESAAIKKFDAVYSLKSPRELADMAERKDIDPAFAMWLYKERSHIKMIIEALYQNPTVSPTLKKDMEKRLGVRPRSQPR